MTGDDADVTSVKKRAKTITTVANVIVICCVLSFVAFVATLTTQLLRVQSTVVGLIFIGLFILMGYFVSVQDKAWRLFIETSVSAAQKYRRTALNDAARNRFDPISDQLDDAVGIIDEANEYLHYITDSDTQQQAKADIETARAEIKDFRQNIGQLHEAMSTIDEHVDEVVEEYGTMAETVGTDPSRPISDKHYEISSEEITIEQSVESFNDVIDGSFIVKPRSPIRRFRDARREFVNALTYRISIANERQAEARLDMGNGQYDGAIKALNDAEIIFEDTRKIVERQALPYRDDFAEELNGVPLDLSFMRNIGDVGAHGLAKAGYRNLTDLAAVSRDELTEVDPITQKTAAQIKTFLSEFPYDEIIDRRVESIRADRKRAREQHITVDSDSVRERLATIDSHIFRGELDAASETLSEAEDYLMNIEEQFESLPNVEIPNEVTSLFDDVESRRDKLSRVKKNVEVLATVDGQIQTARKDIEREHWEDARSKLTEARERCERIATRAIPYPKDAELDSRLNQIDALSTTAENEQKRRQIEDTITECQRVLDETDQGAISPTTREQVISDIDTASELLSSNLSGSDNLSDRLDQLEQQASKERTDPNEPDGTEEPESPEGKPNPAPEPDLKNYMALTEFQRDALTVIAGTDEPKGLAIKDELESYYDDTIHHGRLYPNLDTLVDEGLLDKFAIDNRSNGYRLTDRGYALLEARLRWEQERAPTSNSSDEENEREQMVEAIGEVAEDIGRMPKRNEFLNRTDCGQGDIRGVFESWSDALESAGINIEEALLNEVERVAETIDGEPTSGDMNHHGAYSSGKYSTVFGSWQAALDAADLEVSETSDTIESPQRDNQSSENYPENGNGDKLESNVKFDDLPIDQRYSGEIAIKVIQPREPWPRKDAELKIQDTTGKKIFFEVWSKHDCRVDWDVDTWYTLTEVRLKQWDSDGETIQKLSSSRDINVLRVADPPDGTSNETTKPEQSDDPGDSTANTTTDEDGQQDDEPPEEESLLDTIIAEFDDEEFV